jgi:hypothetical protein
MKWIKQGLKGVGIFMVAFIVFVACLWLSVAWSAGTCIQSAYQDNHYLEMSWAGNATGVVTGCNSTSTICGYVNYFETVPGSPAPNPNYDITVKTMEGRDIAGGGLSNRSVSSIEVIRPVFGAGTDSIPACGKVRLDVTGNNATHTGAGKVRIWYQLNR